MEDKQIIKLYFDRNEQAIKETSDKYGHYCFQTAYHILFSNQDAQECVNDTWVKTWDLIPPNRPNKLKYFLAKITRGFALNLLRTKTREKRGGMEIDLVYEELENVLTTNSNPEKDFAASDLKVTINHFLHQLSKRDCNVFLRRYFYVESIQEIAKRYGLSESNVNVILNRTKNKLKAYLESEGYL